MAFWELEISRTLALRAGWPFEELQCKKYFQNSKACPYPSAGRNHSLQQLCRQVRKYGLLQYDYWLYWKIKEAPKALSGGIHFLDQHLDERQECTFPRILQSTTDENTALRLGRPSRKHCFNCALDRQRHCPRGNWWVCSRLWDSGESFWPQSIFQRLFPRFCSQRMWEQTKLQVAWHGSLQPWESTKNLETALACTFWARKVENYGLSLLGRFVYRHVPEGLFGLWQ